MITLHNKDFTLEYGVINSICEAFVEEERNGLFELSFIVLNTDSLFNYVKEENIIVANANDTLLNQKFRIYMTRKLMNNRVEVFARHISFDLMYDYIDNVSFENQSCEYALNQLFRNSNFSKHYRGYSDIVNAQNYKMSMANVLEAIGGKQGSIIDTFGTGAEILRDNENIHVLNKRGYDNDVIIEYKKNLTGFELEEDTTDLITRILPYAKYTNNETNEEVIVKADYVDSTLIANYSHPFISAIDYSEKFEEDEEVTTSKLIKFAQDEFKINKVDIPKQNFKIDFIPLSKCVGYEGIEDRISLCDTVTIKDTRYNINTKAKVIKTTFNVLKNRYESMELGEPKTSLGDIVGSNDSIKGEKGDKGDKGDKGEDGSIGDFPNSLPSTPVVATTVYGFANIEVSWTFENKVYYQYEVYASKEADFTPNTFNLIHQGQTSSFMYQAKPNETWYFKVCCVNTHGDRTSFGSAYATTSKVSDLSNYVANMAIDDALIGTLNLDRGWVGQLNANLLDVKGNFSVTDGNGKRTLDIDSFGNVNLSPSNVEIDIAQNGVYLTHNGNKRLGLRRGMLQLYNYSNNSFLGGVSPQISQDNTVRGMAVNATPNSQFFAFNYVPSWTSEDNADPTGITSYMVLNYKDRGTSRDLLQGFHLYTSLFAPGINLKGGNLMDATNLNCYGVYGSAWHSSVEGTPLIFSTDGTSFKTHKPINANSNNIYNVGNMTSANVYTNSWYSNTTTPKQIFYTYGSDAFNNTNWNWQGYNLYNAKIVGSTVTYDIASGYNVDVENDTGILIANEDISNIDENGSVSYKLEEMIKLLYNKIHSLEKEINLLKKGGN